MNSIFDQYLTKKNKLNSNKIPLAKCDPKIIKLFEQYDWCKDIKELFFCVTNQVNSKPTCFNCQSDVAYRNPKYGYSISCSKFCASKSPQTKNIKSKLMSSRYDNLLKKYKLNFPWIQSYQEGLHCESNNIKTQPICYCGNYIQYVKGFKYPQRCSYTCANKEDAKAKTHKSIQTKQNMGNLTITSNGMTVGELCKHFNKNHTQALKIFRMFGESSLLKYLNETELNTTTLEKYTQCQLDLKFYNKTPDGKFNDIFFKPDFCVNDTTFLDVDGLYWHSEKYKENDYHQKKRIWFEQQGFRLIQIREDEMLYKTEIVKSMLNFSNKIKIRASKCQVKKISWNQSKQFLMNNHMQGPGPLSSSYGLFYDNKLVCVMTARKNFKRKYEISRFCTDKELIIHGGFSKLLKFIQNKLQFNEIYSWCDLRYSQGNVYESTGFKTVKETLGWSWTDGKLTYNRLTHHKDSEGYNSGKYKIYDAGQRLYVKKF